MLERICPQCGATNAAEQRRCHACGSSMDQSIQRSTRAALSPRRAQLPAHWQQTGRVVALGLLSIAAEAGLQWLSQRQRTAIAPRNKGQQIVAAQQRIVERWHNGQLQERTIERTLWFEPNE